MSGDATAHERWQRITTLYDEALALPAIDRDAFLERRCAGDAGLRREIQELLAWDARAEGFLSEPLTALGTRALGTGAPDSTASASGTSPAAPAPPLLAPDTELEHFRIRRCLGRGGMGEVYEADDLLLQRRVALKLLTSGDGLLQEARAASALSHPHIVTVHAVGRTAPAPGSTGAGQDFLVMEFVEGETLRQLLGAGALPLARVIALATQVADALAAAHACGIVHRDLKPENIMVTPDGQTKLLDFGLAARGTSLDAQAAAVVCGTAAYLAPEQVRGEAVDFRADQFAFGSLLFELTTGVRPFDRETLVGTLTAILHEPPRRPAGPEAAVPLPLAWILARCLAKQPEARYASTRELRDELATLRQRLSEAGDALDLDLPGAVRIPTPSTPLIGREPELDALSRLLREARTRLVTLTGPGGVGKTRLGLQLAQELLAHVGGRAVFVDLSRTQDATLVPVAIARALGVPATSGQPLELTLQDWLRLRRGVPLLLVIDNFEQVLTAAPLLSRLLLSSETLAMIVTSREALRLLDEHAHPVPPLPVPPLPELEGTRELTLADVARYPSVTLFVARAAAVRPGFLLTRQNATDIAAIVAQLDGLPMAIELAAARIRHLSPAEMRTRLQRRLPLLTGGARDRPAHQQTLRGTIDWSHDMLTPPEQTLFRRLAVFAGGATLEALEAVADARQDLGVDIVELATSLADKHLIVPVVDADDRTRFLMLDTMHEYARERLAASGDEPLTRRAHAAYALVLAEEHETCRTPDEHAAWLDRCEAERDNLRAALEHLTHAGDLDWGVRLAVALVPFWTERGHLADGRLLLADLLRHPAAAAPTTLRARALYAAAIMADLYSVDPNDEVRFQRESLEIFRSIGDRRNEAIVLSILGVRENQHGDRALAQRRLEEAIALAGEIGDAQTLARALTNLATLHKNHGQYEEARRGYAQSRTLFASLDAPLAVAWALNHEADAARLQGDIAGARRLLYDARLRFLALHDRWGLGSCAADLGRVAEASDDERAATALYREAVAIFSDLRHWRGVARLFGLLAQRAAGEGQAADALFLAGAAAALWRGMAVGPPRSEADPLERTMAAVRERAVRESAVREGPVREGPVREGTEAIDPVAAWLEGWQAPRALAVARALGSAAATAGSPDRAGV